MFARTHCLPISDTKPSINFKQVDQYVLEKFATCFLETFFYYHKAFSKRKKKCCSNIQNLIVNSKPLNF